MESGLSSTRWVRAAAVRPTPLSLITVPRHTGRIRSRTRAAVAEYGPAPIDAPDTYPGRWPDGPVLITGDQVVGLSTPAEVVTLTRDRMAIAAVGSNACPAQLRRKGLTDPLVLTPVTLVNHLVVYAGHTTSYGAVPATVTRWAGARSDVFLTWLTERQHELLDVTEGGNYDRVMVRTDRDPVTAYRARSGLTRCADGHPVPVAGPSTVGHGLTRLTQPEVKVLRPNAPW